MSLTSIKKFQIKGDERGQLIALEANKDIPFDIKRVYYIFGTQHGVARGFHAHRELQQYLICISGSCTVVMDDGTNRESVVLDAPASGLYVGPMVWHEMYDFSPAAVLLVLASTWYEEDDYLRNYNDFIQSIRAKEKN